MIPEELRYTSEHEWVRLDGSVVRVGITHFAQEQLGDIVYVQLPKAGQAVQTGQPLGEVESTKSVSDIYAPVTGTVVASNPALADRPELVNVEPYGEGWLVEIEVADPTVVRDLLDASAYRTLTQPT